VKPVKPEVNAYIEKVMDVYHHTPGTLGRIRREDRRLALELHKRGVSLDVVQEALLLATARRSLRAMDAAPLAPVRSLHYFVPVIEELIATPLPDGYARYLKQKLRKLQAEHDQSISAQARQRKPG
jgi:hypothetical protein